MTILEALDIYRQSAQLELRTRTIESYDYETRQFSVFVRNCSIHDVRDYIVVEYLQLLKSSGLKQNAIMRKSKSLKRFFKFWHARDPRILNPDFIPEIPREYNQPRVANRDDFMRALSTLPPNSTDAKIARNRAMLLFLKDTGIRVGELLSINVGDLNWEDKSVTIKTEKSRGIKPFRVVFWEDDTDVALQHWLTQRDRLAENVEFADPEALWVGCRCWQTGKRMRNSAVEIAFRHIARNAGIEFLNPHSIRHMFGHDLAKTAANNSVISNLMGHAQMSSSYRYTLMSSPEMKSEYKKFAEKRKEV